MSLSAPRSIALVFMACLIASRGAYAQTMRSPLPRSRADVLLDAGLWPQAEEAYYAQSRVRPREPTSRAALGRYLAMKGAVMPGVVLIEEAQQFGLDSALAARMLRPWRTILGWRSIAALQADSSVAVRPPADTTALFRLPLPSRGRAGASRAVIASGRYGDTLWADVVPRQIGADSLYTKSPRIGFELLEGLVPSYDTTTRRVTLHANSRSALQVKGEGTQRFPVLRDARGVHVLMTSGRTLSLVSALRELAPRWWQLDLLHGVLVVK